MIEDILTEIGIKARKASKKLATISTVIKNDAIKFVADQIDKKRGDILNTNEIDVNMAISKKLSNPMIDRLMIDDKRITDMINNLLLISELDDPLGKVMEIIERPSGLKIKKVRTPIGVIGIIFESRPNVFLDAGSLCLKSGNASILRCGSESFETTNMLKKCFDLGLEKSNMDKNVVQLIPTKDRKAVETLIGLHEFVDVIVPRGGKSLVNLIQKKAKIPVFAHLEGIVHIYIDEYADLEIARKVIINSKMRRPGICGAVECLLINKKFFECHNAPFLIDLISLGVEVRVSKELSSIPGTISAKIDDWGKEYLDTIISAKIVKNIDEAINHISNYGSGHTDCIITENKNMSEKFFNELDSSILMKNSSTQFADGGEFGFGAEIGISTGKIHARGPIGCEQLTTFKYIVESKGSIRD
tara:strand:+ start:125 stop:1375 length:1251 start_codon:yes stop_codon:yes gene_type:complete